MISIRHITGKLNKEDNLQNYIMISDQDEILLVDKHLCSINFESYQNFVDSFILKENDNTNIVVTL